MSSVLASLKEINQGFFKWSLALDWEQNTETDQEWNASEFRSPETF